MFGWSLIRINQYGETGVVASLKNGTNQKRSHNGENVLAQVIDHCNSESS